MFSRRTAAKLGAAVLLPFVARIPTTVNAEPELASNDELVFGPVFEGKVMLHVDGAAGTEIDVWGDVKCRSINGTWFFALHPTLRSQLGQHEQREIAACEAAGLPALAVV